MKPFIEQHGYETPQPLTPDGSSRQYFRVNKSGRTAILMSGGDVQSNARFTQVAKWLRAQDLSAPKILAEDEAGGLLLLEDYGETTFTKAIEQGAGVHALYEEAAHVLAYLTHRKYPDFLPNYYESRIHEGRRRVIDWYLPAVKGQKNPDGIVEAYFKVWEDIEYQLPHAQQGFVHGDYHLENLMLLEDRNDLRRVGLLDFQDAMVGPVLYDLANLLEDARRDVPRDIYEALYGDLDELDQGWLRILATQFHCRIIGQCLRWAIVEDKPQYLQHIPRLENYISRALNDPLLKPLKLFFDDLGLDFSASERLNMPEISRVIREDAF